MNNSKPKQPDNKLGLILLGSAIVLSGWIVFTIDYGSQNRAINGNSVTIPTKNATLLRTPRAITPFTLSTHSGAPYTSDSLKGKWTIFSFGYTSCPDVCPTALATLSQMDNQLKREQFSAPYQVIFLSVDPERDSLKRLAEYVPYFNPSFQGITGDPQEIAVFTRQVGVMYAKSETTDSAMGYLMDHSATFVLTNPKGKFHAVFSPPHKPLSLSKDLQTIVEAY